jgi:hypothetical protein
MNEVRMEEKKGMKPWVKIALIAAAVLFFVCGGGAYLLLKLAGTAMKGVTDEGTKLRVTRSICDIELPAGYKIALGLDMAGIKVSMITHPSTGQEIFLVKIPETGSGKTDMKKAFQDERFANELLNRNRSGNSLKVKKVKARALARINGHDFPYMLCDYEKQGEAREGIFGYYLCTDTKKDFMVMAYNAPGKYSNECTMRLLSSLKCH